MNTAARAGRMPRWQRWTTWIVVGACLASGLAYWLALDVLEADGSYTKPWWIAHGLSSLVALLAIGGALAQHVRATWRAARARVTGSANLVALAILVVTALAMFYGPPSWRDLAIATHWIVGLVALVLFPLHVLRGRARGARGADGGAASR